LIFASLCTTLMVQRVGTLDLDCSTERMWPVIVDPPDLTETARPLSCAIRKRRTSFWSVVSNVNMGSFLAAAIQGTPSPGLGPRGAKSLLRSIAPVGIAAN
jgi:hypothetical protein